MSSHPDSLFTGKERDTETGLDYFGARFNASTMGRFMSPDPLMMNALRVINPQRLNLYSYAVNNPLTYVDPDGRDAVAVGFSKLAGGLGHMGTISVHKNGNASFMEFGPKHAGRPFDSGKVTTYGLTTQVKFDADGLPSKESLAALAKELALKTGEPESSISLAYYQTSESETQALDSYFQESKDQGWVPYIGGLFDCRTYSLAGLGRAGVSLDPRVNNNLPPNEILRLLMAQAQAFSTPKTREPDPEGNPKKPDKPGCLKTRDGQCVDK